MSAPAPPRGAAAEDRAGTARAVRGGWLGLLGSGVNAAAGFLLVAVVTRGVGAAGAGVVFTGVAVFTIASNAAKLGADTALVRFVARDLVATGGRTVPRLLRAAVVPALAAGTAAAGVLLAPPVARALLPGLPPGEAVAVVRLFAVFLPVATVSLVLLGATRGYGTVVPFVGVEQVGKPLLRVLAALPLALLAPGVPTLAAAWLLPTPLGAAVAWWALRRCRRPRRPDPGGPAASAREFWRFAAPRAVSSIFDIASVWVGVVLLSMLGTSADAGVYTAVGRLVTAGTLLQLAVRLAVAPQLSSLLSRERPAAAEALHRLSTRWIVLFSWPLFAVLAVFPGTVLSVFGAGFRHGAAALAALCAASAVNVAVGNAQTVVLMAGRSSWNLGTTAAAFTAQVGLGVALVPHWGVLGAAAAWGAAIVVDNLASAYLVRRRLGFRTTDRRYLAAAGPALAVAAAAVAVRAVWGDSPRGLSAGLPLCGAVLCAALWRFRAALGMGELVAAVRGGPGAGGR